MSQPPTGNTPPQAHYYIQANHVSIGNASPTSPSSANLPYSSASQYKIIQQGGRANSSNLLAATDNLKLNPKNGRKEPAGHYHGHTGHQQGHVGRPKAHSGQHKPDSRRTIPNPKQGKAHHTYENVQFSNSNDSSDISYTGDLTRFDSTGRIRHMPMAEQDKERAKEEKRRQEKLQRRERRLR